MWSDSLTREMAEAVGTNFLTSRQLAAGMRRIKLPLAVATTLPGIPDTYGKAETLLHQAGWKVLGQRYNPNSGNLLTLWYKRFPKNRRLTLKEWKNGGACFDPDCCGLAIYDGRPIHTDNDFLAIARILKGQKAPRGWRRFASFHDCSYWTNLTPPKKGAR